MYVLCLGIPQHKYPFFTDVKWRKLIMKNKTSAFVTHICIFGVQRKWNTMMDGDLCVHGYQRQKIWPSYMDGVPTLYYIHGKYHQK